MRVLPLWIAALLALPAAADWEATVRFSHEPPRPGDEGRIHVKGGKVRIDQVTPAGPTVVLYAAGEPKARVLFPELREYLELDAKLAGAGLLPPVCKAGPARACLAAQGFSRSGEESVAGVPCEIWQSVQSTRMGAVRQAIWIPASAKKELEFLRFVTRTARGATRMDLIDVHAATQDDALFRIPKDFHRK